MVVMVAVIVVMVVVLLVIERRYGWDLRAYSMLRPKTRRLKELGFCMPPVGPPVSMPS